MPALDGLFEGGGRGGFVGLHAFLVNPEEVVHHHAAVEQAGRIERLPYMEADKMCAEALRQVRRHIQSVPYRFAGVAMNQNGSIAHRSPPVSCRGWCATSGRWAF